MAALFDRNVKTIGKHVQNAIEEELSDFSVVANFATTAADGKTYDVAYYSLDVIISVGYRVKSKRGIEFRKWANSVLKQYILKGYAAWKSCANLLYFVTKNHSFSDGNKRIAATMFLHLLNKNGLLFKNGIKQIEDNTLVALTIMIAESKPDEKELMVNLVMQFLAG